MIASVSILGLQKKLAFASHAISSRSQLPILLHFLLEASKDTLKISSTDLEIGIQTFLPAKVSDEGSTTVPARTFTELINSLSQGDVILKMQDAALEVSTKKVKSLFQTIAKDEFPKLYEEKGEVLALLSTKELHVDFASVIFAASVDTARPALSGVLLRQEEEGFLLVATDGYRLSLKHSATKLKTDNNGGGGVSMIVPARAFREIISAKDEGETIAVFVSKEKNQILFQIGQTELVGRLIEAEFPSFEKIIPNDFSLTTTFDREELLKAVKICSIFARDSANIIKLSIRKDSIIVSSQTPSLGENTVEVEAKMIGEENEIAFNARYLLDVLSHLEPEELTFEMSGPLNPGVFRIKDDTSFLHLIMPIRIQQ
ncbi:MAG: DNA polymerase III subunit beta [Candidatus Levybacteria bacterium]|nr:DNA polymerase III subunit beta [Candidatus Levybacteria bacterium]